MGKALGIDLGTTHSAMAIIDETGRPKIIPNREGKNTTPSVVLFRDDEVVVGERAKRAAIAEKDNVAMIVKRHMCEPEWTFTDGKGKEHRPEEISALILKRMKKDAETALGEEIKDAVITVPAYFEDMERNRTKDAGKLAGFNVLRIINEPTAAAIAYALQNMGQERLVMVYDLGGGTFDVTIIRIKDTEIEVVTSDGDKRLGGVDFDEALVNYFAENFNNKYGINSLMDMRTYQDFYARAEGAKLDLSADTVTYVSLSAEGKTEDMEIQRAEFENLIRARVQTTMDIAQEALDAAGRKLGKSMSWGDIDTVLLVGGSTRIPMVNQMVEELTGKKPQVGLNPDEVVAIGASIVAAQEIGITTRNPEGDPLPPAPIQDITAHALGVQAKDKENGKEYNSIIIEKDSQIPVEKSQEYTTIKDNQTSVRIIILQGEDEDPQYCAIIGNKGGYTLDGIPPMRAGEPKIKFTMAYDREGIVNLIAEELSTGKKLDIKIDNPSLISREEMGKIEDGIREMPIK